MQVKSLLIKDFQQFKDFSLDLCYPKGHEFEGQPLKKVCIIGQSGTGKTTLLNFLREVLECNLEERYSRRLVHNHKYDYFELNYEKYKESKIEISEKYGTVTFYINAGFKNGLEFLLSMAKNLSADKESSKPEEKELSKSIINRISSNLKTIYIPANQNLDFPSKINPSEKDTLNKDSSHHIINQDSFDFYWSLILETIEEFKETLIQRRNEFAKLATNANTSTQQLTDEAQNLKEWEKSRVNPLKKLGDEFLDRILYHFNLRVKTEVDFQDIGFIKLETLRGESVESDVWSTATKQVILTALPLYALKPESTIVFFDEPERSLYPDIQTKVVDFYTSLAPDSQFFFATHSPMIAAGFEPWEIVELKFNEEGKVYREQYFEGENHVNNYKIDPRFLVYDSILKNVFDIKERTNEKRTEGLMELAMLEKRMENMNGSNPAEKEKLWGKYEALADKLDWKIK